MSYKYYRTVESASWCKQTQVRFNSKTNRKVKSIFSTDMLSEKIAASRFSHLHRADETNCGDWWSLPANYFSFPNHDNVFDISDVREDDEFYGWVIAGGGGLIGPAFPELPRIVNSGNTRVIGWGLGNNMIDRKMEGFVSEFPEFPDYVRNFDMLGVRDDIPGYRWVPCASCMHPIFSESFEIKHEIVVFEHKRIPMGISGVPVMTNACGDIITVVDFLASGNVVVTNSYHGAYWATLLGRKCIAVPFSSKFNRMRFSPALCHRNDWQVALDLCVSYPEALSECRLSNIKFYNDVMEYIYSFR